MLPSWLARLFVAPAALCLLLVAPGTAAASGSGSFSPTGSMGTPREGAVAARLPDGRILVAGGYTPAVVATAEVFNPASGTFSSAGIGSMTTPTADAAAVALRDGRVLIAGGYDGANVLKSAEVFNPATNSFSAVNAMGTARENPAAALLPDGRVLVAGGSNSGDIGTAEIFNPATGNWTPATGSLNTPRDGGVAAPLPDGRVLVAGGHGNSSPWLTSAEVYNSATETFGATGSMGTPRSRAAGATLPDGRILVMGGVGGSGLSNIFASAEVFNAATGTFSSAGVGSMASQRVGPVAATLSDGRVLVAGGRYTSPPLASAEIFAATNSFSVGVKEKKLLVGVEASGTVTVSDASAALAAAAAKKKGRLLLRPTSASGDPPTITVALRLTKPTRTKLRQKGKLTVNARIRFAPQGGVAKTQTVKLRIRSKQK